MGSVINYPGVVVVQNIIPNMTYYVGVQGIGSPTDVYKISATIQYHDWVRPVRLEVCLDL